MSLSDFTVGEKLGKGAYSTVYRVERLSDTQVYALKKVRLGSLKEKEVENALNEVRILASVKHDNIIRYRQAFLDGHSLCIIMEYADDGDLYQKIVEKRKTKQYFAEADIWSVLVQTVLGLRVLHSLNILHRDLKSANIFLNKMKGAKLGDLNVSKVAQNGMLHTQTGTPFYASPEVWKDEPYDAKSDIWSLGCVIYEMTALEPPFKAEDMEGLFKAVTLGVYPPIPTHYSRDLAHIIKLMLQQKPKSRPSAQKIFTSSLLQAKIQELNLFLPPDTHAQLLKTIHIPKKLHSLTDRLPKASYENLSQHHSLNHDSHHDSMSKASLAKGSLSKASLAKGSLPKLSQGSKLSKASQGSQGSQPKRPKKRKMEGLLMVEGRSKILEDARSSEKHGRNLQKQIRDQLRKIYNVKRTEEQKHKRSNQSIVLPPIRL